MWGSGRLLLWTIAGGKEPEVVRLLVPGLRALITGGAGLIGSTLAETLVREGAERVVILDNFSRGTWANLEAIKDHPLVEIIEGDIRDLDVVRSATHGVDAVFHQAAIRTTRCAEAPREAVEVLIVGTLNVLEAAAHAGVQKIIAASSASVYGDPSYIPMDEVHPFNNRTLYGACKIANEQMYRAFFDMYGLGWVALRYFNVYGPRMDIVGVYTEVIIKWLDRLDAGEPPIIYGDGEQTLDFIFVDDVVRANLLALECPATNTVFNVGTGAGVSVRELAELLLEIMDSSNLRPYFKAGSHVGEARHRVADMRLAKEQLGFEARVGLREGLERLIAWRFEQKARAPQKVPTEKEGS
jgi:UDP-glucose 4-epimerase